MTTNSQDRAILAGRLSAQSNKAWMSENRELLVSFSPVDLQAAMLAVIKLRYRDQIRDSEPSVSFYTDIQNRVFLDLLDRGVVTEIFPLTDLGWQAIEAMRRSSGVGLDQLPQPPPPALSAAELLEKQVALDFATLSSDQFRKKLNDSKAYRETYKRIADTPAIDAGPTRLIRIGG
jgi:hypothetical protein